MGLSFVSIKASTSESGQCDCHFARCGSDGGPLQHRPSQRPPSLVIPHRTRPPVVSSATQERGGFVPNLGTCFGG